MPGCSLKEVFPEFSKSVNLNPSLPPGAQRYGVEAMESAGVKPLGEDTMFNESPGTKRFKLEDARGTSRPLIEHFENSVSYTDSLPKPYQDRESDTSCAKNVGKFEQVIPANIEEMLETSVGDMDVDPFGGVEYPSGLDYSFDKNPYNRVEEKSKLQRRESHRIGNCVSEKMLIHVKRCEGCRERLKGVVGNVIVRETSMSSMEQMTEFLTFVGMGIFIIFVLDIMKRKR